MTMTTTLDLDALEAIAAAATPGPWQPYASQPEVSVMCSGKVLASIEVRNGFGWRDMEHIAAFSPTTALALIARVRELERRPLSVSYRHVLKDYMAGGEDYVVESNRIEEPPGTCEWDVIIRSEHYMERKK
jgi:hypothetical protein